MEKLLSDLKKIKYGWIDKNGQKYLNKISKENFFNDYYLQSPTEVLKNEIGICWDQVEFERDYLEQKGIPCKTIFMKYEDGNRLRLHTFLIYKKGNKIVWLENTYPRCLGAFEFNNIAECFNKVHREFCKENLIENPILPTKFIEYTKPQYGIGYEEYITHCHKGKLLNDDYSNLSAW